MSEVATTEPCETPEEPLVDAQRVPPQGEPCGACGCPLEHEDKFCPACGTPHEPTRAVEPEEDELVPSLPVDQKHFHCNACGANVQLQPKSLSYVCPFCDSTMVVEYAPEITGRQLPEFIIGFQLTHQQALERFRKWIKDNAWYRPGDLHQAKIEEKLRGVYLPFWTFSMLAESDWNATIGEYWYRTETYTTMQNGKMVTRTRQVQETEWWPLSGKHHRYYSGYLVSASKGLTQAEADRIKPFNLPALRRYQPYYLAGWAAEEYRMESAEAHDICQNKFYADEQQNIAAFLPGDTHRDLRVFTNFSNENSDLCLLPVYLLSYRYQDKLYRFLVNGQTGKMQGDKPVSTKRILAAVGVGVVALLLFILLMMLLGAFA